MTVTWLLSALVLLLMSSCVATRYSPPLDLDLTPAALHFLEARSVAVEGTTFTRDVCDPSLARAVDSPVATITILGNHTETRAGRGFQCFEPMLYVLTLGIVPADCAWDYAFEATVEGDKGQAALRQNYTRTTVQGWVAALLALFPGWELDFRSESHACRRAFNTVVNRISAQDSQR